MASELNGLGLIFNTTKMTNIINLHTARHARLQARAQGGNTLCQSGFHQWQAVKDQPFKVHNGKLLTAERCQCCNEERTRLT
jgi:hypothetical protein